MTEVTLQPKSFYCCSQFVLPPPVPCAECAAVICFTILIAELGLSLWSPRSEPYIKVTEKACVPVKSGKSSLCQSQCCDHRTSSHTGKPSQQCQGEEQRMGSLRTVLETIQPLLPMSKLCRIERMDEKGTLCNLDQNTLLNYQILERVGKAYSEVSSRLMGR